MIGKVVLALLVSATTLLAQTSIDDVSRSQGSVGGGDVVLVHLVNPPYCDPAACQFTVSFGGVAAQRTEQISADTLRVITPQHASGNVEVTLSVGPNIVAKYPAFFRFAGMGEIGAPDTYNFEIVVIPLAVGSDAPVPGAFGSMWTTELWVSNSGDADVELFNGYPACSDACRGTRFPVIAAHSSRLVPFKADVTSAGYLFYVQKGGAQNVHFSLRVRDVSRSSDNAGTELPVFRLSAFGSIAPATLLNVPVEETSRTSLRIYGDGALPARLRVFRMADDALIVDEPVAVAPADLKPYGDTLGFPARSEYAQISDLRAAFPQLAAGRYRIEVTSDAGWLRVLATVTNNSTQLITAIPSQPDERYGEIRQ